MNIAMAAVDRLRRSLALLASRAALRLVQDGPRQRVQVALLEGELRNAVERLQQYGLTSVPRAGADAVVLSVGGTRDNPVVVVADHPRERPSGLESGDVALWCLHGPWKVLLTAAGVTVDGGGQPVTITNTPKVRMETDIVEVTGEVKDRCDTSGRTMADMRDMYNAHVHPDAQGGLTGVPTEDM